MSKAIVGIIGGSGVYHLPGLRDEREVRVATPWGEPSDRLRFGRIGDIEAVFLPRHGRGHRLAPNGINYRANIDALKQVGVTDLVSVSGLRLLQGGTAARHVRHRRPVRRSYRRAAILVLLGNGCVGPRLDGASGVAVAGRPLPSPRRRRRASSRGTAALTFAWRGRSFSSLAESLGYKAMGYDVIGMTAMPEAKLAREAELSYAIVAMVTDFDCWHADPRQRGCRLDYRRDAGERRKGRPASGKAAP